MITGAQIIELAEGPDKILGSNFDKGNIHPSSYNLRIGTVFHDNTIISKDHPQENGKWEVQVQPSEIISILTLEELNMPVDLCGTVYAVNELSSVGLLILNSGHVDPGYKGPLTVCAINLSKEPRSMRLGDDIFVMVFEKLDQKTNGYFNDTSLIAKSRKDREENYMQHRARKLSGSLFDLMESNEYKPYLSDLINEIVEKKTKELQKRLSNGIVIVATVIAAIAGIIALYPVFHDSHQNDNKKTNTQIIDTPKSKTGR